MFTRLEKRNYSVSRRKRLITIFTMVSHLFSKYRGIRSLRLLPFSSSSSSILARDFPAACSRIHCWEGTILESSATADTRAADPSERVSRTDGAEFGWAIHARWARGCTIVLHTPKRVHTNTLAGKVSTSLYVAFTWHKEVYKNRVLGQFTLYSQTGVYIFG